MKGFEGQQNNETYPQEIVNLIHESPEAIDAEFARTANSWVACAKGRLFAIQTTLLGAERHSEVTPELGARLHENIHLLSKHLEALSSLLPDKESEISHDVKAEVFRRFAVLLDAQSE